MKTIIFFSALFLFLPSLPAQALVRPPASLPALSLPDTDGQAYFLPDLMKDKVAMLVYWSVTCPHCHQMMPHFLFMNKRLTGNNFVMIFVNSDGMSMAEAVKNYAASQKIPEPWLMDEGPDDSMPLAQLLDIAATPSAFVYDVKGSLRLSQETTQNDQVDIDLLLDTVQKSF
jgi:thiol-disulfide isomerase/thioredoxin